MSDTNDTGATSAEAAELIDAGGKAPATTEAPEPDVSDPAKLIRLGTMLQAVLAELQTAGGVGDPAGLQRLADIHTETVDELSTILSDDLRNELMEFNNCCGNEAPTEGELRVAHAQLVGWIQGLLRGMQATATAQAQMAQQQMLMMQQQRALGGTPGGMPVAPQGQQPRRAPGGPAVPDSGYL